MVVEYVPSVELISREYSPGIGQNGIKHRLTAPYSPTTTGKVERWHKTLREDFLTSKVFADTETAVLPTRKLKAQSGGASIPGPNALSSFGQPLSVEPRRS